MKTKLRRIMVKVSGELLLGNKTGNYPIDDDAIYGMACSLLALKRKHNLQLAVSVGGGNIFRGRNAQGLVKSKLSSVSADYIGLLGTVINGRALFDALRSAGASPMLFSDIVDARIAGRFDPDHIEVDRLFQSDSILIFTGTGDPGDGITSDTVAALKAIQLRCSLWMKATRVDGIYDRDPQSGGARRYSNVSYEDVIHMAASVMDPEAVVKSRRAGIPIRVFRFGGDCLGNLEKAFAGKIGTIISSEDTEYAQ